MSKLIIGNYGYTSNILGGQTIKTRNIYQLFKLKCKEENVEGFDIDILYQSKSKTFLLFYKIIIHDEIIIVPGQKFLKTLFPIIGLLNRVFKKKLIVFGVGGWLNDFLKSNQYLISFLNTADSIFVESNSLRRCLVDNIGFQNVYTVPNFRIHSFIVPKIEKRNVFKIVFMARITETKGCNILFDLMKYFQMNVKDLSKEIHLDFYGPIDKAYEDEFFLKLNDSPLCSYNGIISPSDVFKKLSGYDLCVLPTFHEGEGFPGTIIDSYIAGVPVIVSNWKNLPEFVDHDKCGFVFDTFDSLTLYIKKCVNDDKKLQELKNEARIKSLEFSAERSWEIITKYI